MKTPLLKIVVLVAVDFMVIDLTDALFANCDLYRSNFGAKLYEQILHQLQLHY
jgi:uncharacterized membrane protein